MLWFINIQVISCVIGWLSITCYLSSIVIENSLKRNENASNWYKVRIRSNPAQILAVCLQNLTRTNLPNENHLIIMLHGHTECKTCYLIYWNKCDWACLTDIFVISSKYIKSEWRIIWIITYLANLFRCQLRKEDKTLNQMLNTCFPKIALFCTSIYWRVQSVLYFCRISFEIYIPGWVNALQSRYTLP